MGETLKITKEVAYYTEAEARQAQDDAFIDASKNNYIIGSADIVYKKKTSKKEIVGEKWVLKITEVHGELWD